MPSVETTLLHVHSDIFQSLVLRDVQIVYRVFVAVPGLGHD